MNPNVQTAEVLPPRAMLFLGIVALHVVLWYFLASGLMTATIAILVPPVIHGEIMKDTKKPEPQKTVIENPKLVDPVRFEVPLPPIPLDPTETPDFAGAVVETPTDPLPITPGGFVAPSEPPIRLVGRNLMPNTDAYYPPSAIRAGVQGAVVVRACVNEGARLDGAPVVEGSSGSAQLDNAALRVARDTRYARSMRGDTPVSNCHRFRVIFAIN